MDVIKRWKRKIEKHLLKNKKLSKQKVEKKKQREKLLSFLNTIK